MDDFAGCQFPLLHDISERAIHLERASFKLQIKRYLASPWNHFVKPWVKKGISRLTRAGILPRKKTATAVNARKDTPPLVLQPGDWVRIHSAEEIRATLGSFNEIKGCAFIKDMWQYCGTVQQVLKPVERFLDERDYRVKKVRGIVILKGLYCQGTEVFGRCDRTCHLFWRTEWLEKVDPPAEGELSSL